MNATVVKVVATDHPLTPIRTTNTEPRTDPQDRMKWGWGTGNITLTGREMGNEAAVQQEAEEEGVVRRIALFLIASFERSPDSTQLINTQSDKIVRERGRAKGRLNVNAN